MEKKTITIGIVFTVLFLLVAVATLPDYGLTWDFHFHFFSGAHFFGLKWQEVEPRPLPYVEPDPRNTVRLPYGPFVQIIPFTSWLLFYKNLNLLPYDVAYNLPIVFAGVLGIGALYFLLAQAFNWRVGLLAALFLALTPRYFADLHNDMKDAPMAAVFTLNMWMLWWLVTYHRPKDLLLAALAFALAFNTKINSIFIPAIFAAWLFLLFIFNKYRPQFTINYKLLTYFLLAPLFAFLLWWYFWGDPVGQLKLAVSTFGGGADNIEVLLSGNWYCAGSTVPWYYPYWYLFITTPIPILFFFGIGIANILSNILRNFQFSLRPRSGRAIFNFQTLSDGLTKLARGGVRFGERHAIFLWRKSLNGKWLGGGLHKRHTDLSAANRTAPKNAFPEPFATNLLLILWLFLPLTRYLLPKIAVIDGIRHFEEVLYPITAIAAIGAATTLTWLQHLLSHKSNAICVAVAMVKTILFGGMFILLTASIVRYHPFQISYFNELVGGAKGAFGKYDLDYWGSSQKKAVEWLNVHAENNATVTIVMAGNVAGTYLRPDLLTNLNSQSYDAVDYVVVLNRQSFFYRFYIYEYLLTHKPIHTIDVDGVPLVWIFDNRLPKIPRQTPWWSDEDPCIIKYWQVSK